MIKLCFLYLFNLLLINRYSLRVQCPHQAHYTFVTCGLLNTV